MRIGLVLHPAKGTALAAATEIVDHALERGMDISVPDADLERLPRATTWDTAAPDAVDVVIAVGGDGTMLEAARIARGAGTPIVGVNAGTVGFLTEVDPTGVAEMLERLATGAYTVSERMTLMASVGSEQVEALNDVVAEKAISQHIVVISVAIDGEPLVEYRADGVIVATPTGSTAYTFSAGGPLVDPEVDALLLTAVAPHNLFGRAFMFGADSTIELTIAGDRPANVHADGRAVIALEPGDRITVTAGPMRDRIIRFGPTSFTRTVMDKFGRDRAR